MRRMLGVLSVALVAGTAVMANASSESGSSRAREQLVCKQQARTGTRFTTRTCYTKAQREKMIEEQRREAAELVNRPQIETRRE